METGLKYRKTFKEGIRKGSDILHDNKLLMEKFLIREKYNIVDEEYFSRTVFDPHITGSQGINK